MTTNRRFNVALEALARFNWAADSEHPLQTQPTNESTELEQTLAGVGPLPREALFLGMASDGLPVLLNLHDPLPGPMLVIGDEGAGKTDFLQSVVRAAALTHDPSDLQLAVITSRPAEWEPIETTPHLTGVFSIQQRETQELIQSLAEWAHITKNALQTILLLVDDLESAVKWDEDVLQRFRWLLLRGTARRVWPLVTLNANQYGQVIAWLDLFRTRIFCQIGKDQIARTLGADLTSGVNQLEAGRQFALRENGAWLQFCIDRYL